MRSIPLEKLQRKLQPLINNLLYYSLGACLRRCFKLTYEGRRNIPARGPYLIAAKQNTNYDPLLIAMGLWKLGISSRYIMRDLYLPPLLRGLTLFALSWAGARRIFREREIRRRQHRTRRRKILNEARERISGESGYLALEAADQGCLLFFPEGTRSMGKMKPFRREFFEAAVALNRGIHVIPVGIEYAGKKRVTIRFGQAIPCHGDADVIRKRCFQSCCRLSGLEDAAETMAESNEPT